MNHSLVHTSPTPAPLLSVARLLETIGFSGSGKSEERKSA